MARYEVACAVSATRPARVTNTSDDAGLICW
jgi:hypothetical protein